MPPGVPLLPDRSRRVCSTSTASSPRRRRSTRLPGRRCSMPSCSTGRTRRARRPVPSSCRATTSTTSTGSFARTASGRFSRRAASRSRRGRPTTRRPRRPSTGWRTARTRSCSSSSSVKASTSTRVDPLRRGRARGGAAAGSRLGEQELPGGARRRGHRGPLRGADRRDRRRAAAAAREAGARATTSSSITTAGTSSWTAVASMPSTRSIEGVATS